MAARMVAEVEEVAGERRRDILPFHSFNL